MELISPNLRSAFREFCVGLYLGQIEDIFQMANIQRGTIASGRSISGERRTRVEEYYATLDWTSIEGAQKFLQAVGLVISQSYIDKSIKDLIVNLCREEGLIVEGNQVRLSDQHADVDGDLFRMQFPGGLPFGMSKPDFAITAEHGGQSLKFEWKAGIGIIWKDVYPCYDFQTFQAAYGITSATNPALKQSFMAMNQTPSEKVFFQTYAKHFGMADSWVPLLIPQAWIQWHSLSKRDLTAKKSLQASELYRVDFVAFWEYQRYAILVDDIGHYAVKRGDQWIADEEAYSRRLEEDRRLQIEGWRIYRISNWEIRDEQRLMKALVDLQSLIGF